MVLDLVYNGLVLEYGPVVCEIYRLWGFGQDLYFSAGIVVAFFEGGEGGSSATFEAEGGG